MSDPKCVWKFYWDCGRMGEVRGVFVATEAEVNAKIGSRVSFGEILGKHSNVDGTLDEKDLTLVSRNYEVVQVIEENDLTSGYNPLDYIESE